LQSANPGYEQTKTFTFESLIAEPGSYNFLT
jgi:hypothetical protein